MSVEIGRDKSPGSLAIVTESWAIATRVSVPKSSVNKNRRCMSACCRVGCNLTIAYARNCGSGDIATETVDLVGDTVETHAIIVGIGTVFRRIVRRTGWQDYALRVIGGQAVRRCRTSHSRRLNNIVHKDSARE